MVAVSNSVKKKKGPRARIMKLHYIWLTFFTYYGKAFCQKTGVSPCRHLS
ncbi:MAG: hypothetical protein A4E72_01240 [Syntrophus sp. PtaU1.Bin208]|nr:MAG: hypothetical protein A4E72_01240 [Syntrophus sp. PtaU1.Bin208]